MKQEHRTDVNMEQCELEDDNGNEGNIHRTADESVDDENGYDIEDQYRTHSEDGSDNLSTVIFPTLYFSICLCLSVYVYFSVGLSFRLSVDLSVYRLLLCLPICLLFCLSVCLSIFLSVCLSVYSSVGLSACLSAFGDLYIFDLLSISYYIIIPY